MGMLAATLLAALGVAAPAAPAAERSAIDRGGVSTPGLTAAERRALDIDRITARGGPWGVIVRVRLKGDITALGRGRLRSAIVAMVLHPRSRTQRPSVLATRGPLNRLDILRRTRTADVDVVRDLREIDFMVLGGGLASVRRIEIKAFASAPRPRARGAVKRPLTVAELNNLLAQAPADDGSVAAPPVADPDVCRLLREDARTYARQEEERSNERIQAILRGQSANVDDLNRIIPQIKTARSRLRPVLGRNRCFSINTSFGYEHFQGFTRICGDFNYDLPVALFQPGAYRLFRLNEVTGVFEEVPNAFDAGGLRSFTAVGVGFRIEQYGTYKVVFKDRDLAQPVERLITVPPPEPQQTRDCG
jgi:hypothetical protein